MFAYVDETGNTGKNIFDLDQPDFFTGALITKTNRRATCLVPDFDGLGLQ